MGTRRIAVLIPEPDRTLAQQAIADPARFAFGEIRNLAKLDVAFSRKNWPGMHSRQFF